MDEQMSLGVSGTCDYISTKKMAWLLGLTEARIGQLAREPMGDSTVLIKSSQGWHIDNIKRYLDYKALKKEKTAKEQLEELRVEEKRMDLDERKRLLVRTVDIEGILVPMIREVVENLMRLPSEKADLWFRCTTPLELSTLITEELEKVLNEISESLIELACPYALEEAA